MAGWVVPDGRRGCGYEEADFGVPVCGFQVLGALRVVRQRDEQRHIVGRERRAEGASLSTWDAWRQSAVSNLSSDRAEMLRVGRLARGTCRAWQGRL